MKKLILVLVMALSLVANDIILKESCTDVSTTANNIKDIVSSKGLSVFALIDHKANAQTVEMNLNESKMVIFGNPKVGTVLMQQDLSVGLDLPLRILVFKDRDGKVKMAYRDGSWLVSQHELDTPKKEIKINKAMAMFVKKAGQCTRD